MTTDPMIRDGYADAIAWIRCTLRGDQEGKAAIALNVTPGYIIEALGNLFIGLAASTTGEPEECLNFLSMHIDRLAVAGEDQ